LCALLAVFVDLSLASATAGAQPRGKSGKASLESLDASRSMSLRRTKSGKGLVGAEEAEELEANRLSAITKSGKAMLILEQPDFTPGVLPSAPALQLDANQLSIALAMTSGDGLQRKFKLTMHAVMEFVDFDNRLGKKTLSFPIGADDKLFVDADAVWYDVMSGRGASLQFGPYMTNWQRVPSSVGSSQYGVQLGVPW
jgi:hypothetical protein